ncbi:unnamed protein product [Moneuplotes crassus]|uniref:Uncharacterized protein n=1 Tax=Euplotes crassus TaxID=5936 RepID=A0AAD2DA22_EUPCR|nr:unnamed protein product [Moneuplotes crassus]
MKQKIIQDMKINVTHNMFLNKRLKSISSSQPQLLGDFTLTKQAYDANKFYRSSKDPKKLGKRTVISLQKAKNSARCVQTAYKNLKYERSCSEFKPLEKLKKINMGKISKQTPKKKIRKESIDNNLIGAENKLLKFYDKVSQSSKRRPKTTSNRKKRNSELGDRIKEALVEQSKAKHKNEFFTKKNIDPANFCFFENTTNNVRSQTSHGAARRKKRNDLLKQNTNHIKVSKYLIEKPASPERMFKYNMSKTEMNVINMGKKPKSKPVTMTSQESPHKEFLKRYKMLMTEHSLKDLRSRRLIQSSRELKRSLKYQSKEVSEKKKKGTDTKKLTVRSRDSTINLLMTTCNAFNQNIKQYREMKDDRNHETEKEKISKIIQDEEKCLNIEYLREEVKKKELEEMELNYKTNQPPIINTDLFKISTGPVQIKLGGNEDQEELSKMMLINNKPRVEGKVTYDEPMVIHNYDSMSRKKFSVPKSMADSMPRKNLDLQKMTVKKLIAENIIGSLKKESKVELRILQKEQELKRKMEEEEIKQKVLKRKMKNFCTQLIVCSNILKKLNLSAEDLMRKNVFPNVPFFRKDSAKLIRAAKSNDLEQLEEILMKNKFTVYDYDTSHQTALHWAAKRNYAEVCKMLIEYGAIVDCRDLGNRTPLLLAAKMDNVKCVKLLLAHGANPISRTFLGHTPLKAAASNRTLSYLKKGYLVMLANKFIDKSERKDVWKREALAYFVNDNESGIPFLM